MTISYLQNGQQADKRNDAFIIQEIKWLTKVLETRMQLYFQQETTYSSIEKIPFIEHAWYQQHFPKNKIDFAERVLIWLALAPILKPQLLDSFYVVNQDTNQRFSETGAVKATQHGGLLPTFETLLFVLSGDDLNARLRYMRQLDKHHFLFAQNYLSLEQSQVSEPFTAAVIQATPDLIELIIQGKEYAPEFSHSFPARALSTPQEWDELILDDYTMYQIEEIKTWVDKGDMMLDEFQLRKKLKPGYRCLFHGPPGTGKTFTAALLGKHTGYDVYRIDLSLIISKYIGETEKNLNRIFDRAEHKKWILFFDEADALFGKRTQVKDAHDRYANQEVSYLLQRVEDFNGLVILATNQKSNIDDAFARRFQSVIDFPMPQPQERYQIWKNTFSAKSPLADVDLYKISEDYELSGGSIMNIVRYCSVKAIQRKDHSIYFEDIEQGIKHELLKEGKTL